MSGFWMAGVLFTYTVILEYERPKGFKENAFAIFAAVLWPVAIGIYVSNRL